MIIRKKLVNKYYSEKHYSTGNDNLDDLLEKAFCEGYEYAQKEFAAYKDPTTRIQKSRAVKELVKAANDKGIKGKNMDQVAKNIVKKANLKELFDTDNKGTIKDALRKKAKETTKLTGISGSDGAWRARKLGSDKLYMIKKGLM